MEKLNVGKSKVLIQEGLIENCSDIILNHFPGCKILIITDKTVASFYLSRLYRNLEKLNFSVQTIVLPGGETDKCLSTAGKIYEVLSENFMTRSDLIIALGGGVITDIAGFVASTYHRGINLISIPTSFLAMIDASIGGKNGLNSNYSKNTIGTFYYPKFVFVDPNVLKTLPESELHCGISEAIKCGAIGDEKLFQILEEQNLQDSIHEVLRRSIDVKKRFIEQDEKDLNQRMMLNFGHTLGHAIEKAYNYKSISHGTAIASGMLLVTKASESLGLTDKGTYSRLKSVFTKYDIGGKIKLSFEELYPLVLKDKKVMNKNLNLILLRKIGEGVVYRLPMEKVSKFMKGVFECE